MINRVAVILSRRSDVAEGAVAEDGRRTPFLLTREGGGESYNTRIEKRVTR
jgi:hypothetical protein